MGQAMRGADCADQDSGPFAVGPCHCERVSGTGEHAADCAGKWLRGTNRQSGVALYVHTITHEVRVRIDMLVQSYAGAPAIAVSYVKPR